MISVSPKWSESCSSSAVVRLPPILIRALLGLACLGVALAEVNPPLKPDDVVTMEVFGEDELTTTSRVMKSGEVSYPLIGTVKIGGLSVEEAAEVVRAAYAAKYIRDPKVRITVAEYSEEMVTVLGAVNAPGQFAIPKIGNFDLASALANAGGLNQLADRNRIVLTRADGSSSTYSATQAQNGSGILLESGDRIIVHQSNFVGKTVTLLGEVRKPGPISMPVDGRLDLLTAIAAAGGFTELANEKKITINRSGKKTQVNVKELTDDGTERIYLQPSDIVTIPERWF